MEMEKLLELVLGVFSLKLALKKPLEMLLKGIGLVFPIFE